MAYASAELSTRGLERVRRGHPWVFRDGLARRLRAAPGEPVELTDARGDLVAVGLADPDSELPVRVFGGPRDRIDARLFGMRIEQAARHRDAWGVTAVTDAWRWVNGESDRLPGFILDLYGRVAVLKLDGPYASWIPPLADALRASGRVDALLFRGAEPEVVFGTVPETVVVTEHGVRMAADLRAGQKTGLFLDQRENRDWVRRHVDAKRVLNLFSYTGGFSLAALAGGAAHVTSVDIAAPALAMLDRSLVENGFDPGRHHGAAEDCYAFLQSAAARGERWDVVVLDPPSLTHSKANLENARKAYERLNIAALKVLAPGGLFCTASCTSRITAEDFQQIVRAAAGKARRTLQVIREAGAGADHPVLLTFPEGRYLKFLGLQSIDD